jgi:hypothetical protein
MTGASAAPASLPGRSYRWAIAAVIAALGAFVVALIIAGLVWARGYEPLGFGSGVSGADPERGLIVDPVPASGGKRVFFPRYRDGGRFTIRFTVTNFGRFAVDIVGFPEDERGGAMTPDRLWVLRRCCSLADGVSRVNDDRPLTVPAGSARTLAVEYVMHGRCTGGTPRDPREGNSMAVADEIALRYRYLRFFERWAFVELPMALAVSCTGGMDVRGG